MEKGLHNLSAFVSKGTDQKSVVLSIYIKNEQVKQSLKRGLFLANVESEDKYEHEHGVKLESMNIIFTSYNQIKFILPIINNTMKENGFGYPFYYIDNKLKEYFI